MGILKLLQLKIPPTTKKIVRNGSKRVCKKFTICDSEESVFICKPTVAACEAHIKLLISMGEPIQPFIIIIGESIWNIKEILVYFDGIKYKFFSAVEALNCCFQIYHVFNLKYPLASHAVWMFIQKYLYELTTSSDVPFFHVTNLVNDLKNNSNSN